MTESDPKAETGDGGQASAAPEPSNAPNDVVMEDVAVTDGGANPDLSGVGDAAGGDDGTAHAETAEAPEMVIESINIHEK